ncbi:MAG: AIR synthase-related protein [Saprospiraceae bacterium]
MKEESFRYNQRGVSASKDEVHRAIEFLDKGIFPNAFCKVLPDIVGSDEAYCNIMHADTAGTKTSLAYIYWKETGDLDVWKGIVEDAIVMNTDDMACIGCVNNIVLSSTIGRNKHLIPGEVIQTIIRHSQDFIEKMEKFGINIHLAGGETADVGDIVRTLDVGYTTFCRMLQKDVVDIQIKPGDYIVGFSSSGRATYEDTYNGGMGSNGLTSAKHDLFHKKYREIYPESFTENMDVNYAYTGSYSLTDSVDIPGSRTTMGKLVLSPTRTYMPVIQQILKEHKNHINGMIHCSGGGQTKVLKFLNNQSLVIKDNLFDVPLLFQLIQKESKANVKEMYQVFNMGHRLEIYTPSLQSAEEMIDISNQYNIEAKVIGRVVSSDSPGVMIKTEHSETFYA